MKRVKESGAFYRNKRKAMEETNKRNEGAILKYVKVPTAKTSDSILDVNSSDTIATELKNQETEVVRERDTDVLVPVIDSSSLSASPVVEAKITVPDQIPTTPNDISTTYRDLDDIGKWPERIDKNLRLLLVQRGWESVQYMNINFATSDTDLIPKGEMRRLTREWFYRTLTNGEKMLRTWMAYSPSKASLFCFCCRLFCSINTPNDSKFCSSNGFNNWQKLNPKVANHESSAQHNQNFCKWKELETRLQKGQTIDKEQQYVVSKETKKWQEILVRIFDIIKFLAKQNLAFRGHREDNTSANRGNFLELVHLLAKYDPVLREHLVKIKMGKKNSITYLSPQIQNEFIAVLGVKVRQQIICQVQKAKYYSIILDSTPDISHKDQTSQVVRYVKIENQKVEVVESFIDFIETKYKTAKEISDMILSKLKADGLNIMDCRAQTYDNAAVMAGKHTGVQQRLKDINPNVEFVPCSNHSLNLVCLHAASTETNSVTFFGTLERCYAFFSMSTHRWEVLIATTRKALKRPQDTRWSARADAVNMTWNHYKAILAAIEKLTEADENLNTRTDAGTLLVAMESFSFLCFLGLWKPVLHEVNDTQNYLQTEGLNVLHCAKKINALQILLTEKREELVEDALTYAKNVCEDLGILMEPPRRRTRKQIYGDGSKDAAVSYENELRRKLFSSLDKVTVEIQERFQQLQNLANRYAFLSPAKLLDVDDHDFNLEHVSHDIDKQEFKLERVRLRTFVEATGNKNELMNSSPLDLLKFITQFKLEVTLPNIIILLRIFLTIAISNASCERSFSKLKIIKNYLRSTMSTLRLTNLAILAIEHEMTETIDIDSAIKDFAVSKSRKLNF